MLSRQLVLSFLSLTVLISSVLAMPMQHRPGSTTEQTEKKNSATLPGKDAQMPWKNYDLVGKWEGPEGFDATWLIFHQDKKFELHKFSRPEPMFISDANQTVTWELDTTRSPAWLDIVVHLKSKKDREKIKQMSGKDHVRMLGIVRIIDKDNLLLTINSNPFQGGRPEEFKQDAIGSMIMNRVRDWKEGDTHTRRSLE